MTNEINNNKELNLEKDISDLILDLTKVKEDFKKVLNKYSQYFSNADKKQQDILHFIEFKKLSTVGSYRLLKELSKVRQERRVAEDNVEFLNKIGREFNFLNTKSIKEILKSKNHSMKTRKYSTRYYNEQTLYGITNNSIKDILESKEVKNDQ